MPVEPAGCDDTLNPPLGVALDATPLIGRPTGVGVFCAGLLSGLVRRSDVRASAFAVSWRRREAIEQVVPDGVATYQRPIPARPVHFMWRRSDVPPLEWFVGKTDVVHGTNFVVPPTRRAAEVMTIHDLTFIRFPDFAEPKSLEFPALIRRALRRGAWVHTHSAYVAAEVVDVFGANPERVRAIASGTPVLAGEPNLTTDDERPLVLPLGTRRYVLAIGTAEPRKDLPGLVQAFDELAQARDDVALVLAGPPGWGTDALAATIARARAGARIVCTGWITDAMKARLLRQAAVLAYPSLYEGFGFPPLEAMAAGVPVVATRAGSLPEVLGDAAVLVDAGDRAALASALARVLDSEELTRALSAGGIERAAGFTWDRCAEGLVRLYRDASDGRPKR